jgi:TPR repeat protein
MRELGGCYLDGDCVPEDQEAGLALYRQAITAGDTMAMRELGGRYMGGRGVPVDRSRAGLYFWAVADRAGLDLGRTCRGQLNDLALAPE